MLQWSRVDAAVEMLGAKELEHQLLPLSMVCVGSH
jgi:hypothetical protein